MRKTTKVLQIMTALACGVGCAGLIMVLSGDVPNVKGWEKLALFGLIVVTGLTAMLMTDMDKQSEIETMNAEEECRW